MSRQLFAVVCTFILFAAFDLSAGQTTTQPCNVYVSYSGSDEGGAGTQDRPFFSLQRAAEENSCRGDEDCVICVEGSTSIPLRMENLRWKYSNRLVIRAWNWLSKDAIRPFIFDLAFEIEDNFSLTLEGLDVGYGPRWETNGVPSYINVTLSDVHVDARLNFSNVPSELYVFDSLFGWNDNGDCFDVVEGANTTVLFYSSKTTCQEIFIAANDVAITDSVFENARISIGTTETITESVIFQNSTISCIGRECLLISCHEDFKEAIDVILSDSTFYGPFEGSGIVRFDSKSFNLVARANTFDCTALNHVHQYSSFLFQSYATWHNMSIDIEEQIVPQECLSLCSPGYASFLGVTDCKECGKGHFSNITDAETCIACPVGTFAPESINTECQPCAPGTFSAERGSAHCTPCPEKYYQDQSGQRECILCENGKINAEQTFCDPCQEGYIMKGYLCTKCAWYLRANKAANKCDPLYLIIASTITGAVLLIGIFAGVLFCVCKSKRKPMYTAVHVVSTVVPSNKSEEGSGKESKVSFSFE